MGCVTVGKQNVKSKTQIDKTNENRQRKNTPTVCSNIARGLVIVGCVRFHKHFKRAAIRYFIILSLFFHGCFVLLLSLLIQAEIYK